MIEIHAILIDKKIEQGQFNKLLNFLPEEKQNKIKKFYKIEDAQRALFSDVLLRILINKRLNIKNNEINFYANKFGKPFLKNNNNFHFNISHSGTWILCALDDMDKIGIDIEKIKPIDFEIAERFFSNEECIELFKKKDNEKLMFFYELWTLKESYIKADGRGLSIPLDSFTIKIYNDIITINTINEFNTCFFKQYNNIDNNYKIAICASNNNIPDYIKIMNTEELFKDADIYL